MGSPIPDTNDLEVAKIAAALELAKIHRDGSKQEHYFKAHLARFKEAYEVVKEATAQTLQVGRSPLGD